MFDLYLITPELEPDELLRRARAALALVPPGRAALQLRAGQLEPAARRALARELRALTRASGVALFINADLELAREVQAEGVQLKERGPSVADARAVLGARAAVGVSRHDLAGVRAAERAGADFATLSPVYDVPDKGRPLGLSGFRAIAQDVALPLVALGGVRANHVPDLIRAGARGVAVIREVFDHPQPGAAALDLLAGIDAGRSPICE